MSSYSDKGVGSNSSSAATMAAAALVAGQPLGDGLYRSTSAGMALLSALKRMRIEKDITHQQYLAILEEFDASFQENLRQQCIENKLSTPIVKAALDNYNIVNADSRIDGTKAKIEILSKSMTADFVHVDCNN